MAGDPELPAMIRCLQREPRSHVIDWVGVDAPPEVVPLRPVKQVRTGRWGRVLIRSHTAVKIQKVVCRGGRLQQVEWRDGPAKTKVALDAFQELIAAQLFGILDIGPTVKHVLLARHLPDWVEDPENPEHRGDRGDGCWYLIIVMQRMRGTMRDLKHMSRARAGELWSAMSAGRLVELVVGLAALNIDHGDLRLDNVMFTVKKGRRNGKKNGDVNGVKGNVKGDVKACLADWGYCKVKPNVSFEKLARDMGAQLADVLKDAGAPRALYSEVRHRTANAEKESTRMAKVMAKMGSG